jgi:outer membrane cobalamin receptor
VTLAAQTATAEEASATLDEMVVTSTGFGESRSIHPGNISKINESDIDFTKSEQPAELSIARRASALNRAAALSI